MKLAHNTISDWVTVALLTLVVTGFGLFAQYRVDAIKAAGSAPITLARTDNR